MNDPSPPRLRETAEEPHALIGFRTNGEWTDLLAQTAALIGALDAIEDEGARKAVFDALEGIDAIHREAMHRLVRLFKEGVLAQVVTDPAIKTLMGMYDLLPEPEPGCAKVWDFLPESDTGARPVDEPVTTQRYPDLPHWSPAPTTGALREGEALICHMEEGTYILAREDGRTYAFSAECEVHGAPMIDGRIDRLSWICPEGPGCVYDIRNGARLGGGPGLDCRPVKSDAAGRFLIGFAMPFEPKMPAF